MPEVFCGLDLELNQPSRKVIQVGLAWGSPGSNIQTASWYINPWEPINPEIQTLTGISDALIYERAQPVREVAAELEALVRRIGPTLLNPIVWGEGDLYALQATFEQAGVAFGALGRRSLDIKTLLVFDALVKGRSAYRGGLSSALKKSGLVFQGLAHRADADALNTLRLFFSLLMEERAIAEVINTFLSLVRK